jgi:hypothetical protein
MSIYCLNLSSKTLIVDVLRMLWRIMWKSYRLGTPLRCRFCEPSISRRLWWGPHRSRFETSCDRPSSQPGRNTSRLRWWAQHSRLVTAAGCVDVSITAGSGTQPAALIAPSQSAREPSQLGCINQHSRLVTWAGCDFHFQISKIAT